jgi:DNA polymerase-1
VDANAIVHRAYHALPPLSTKKGELVNAVYGFSMILLNMIKELKPHYIATCFDLEKPTFRHKEFAEYKAKRVKAPDELYNQIPRIQEVVKALNIPIFEKEGYEADDLIGALSRQAVKQRDVDVVIVTGDLDTLQLVDENTEVYTMRRGLTDTTIYDLEQVRERFGFEPKLMTDYKGLRGDPSDNIPGVPGVGEKTATDLVKKYGSIKNIYENLDQLPAKQQNNLTEFKEQAIFSKKLATIVVDVPIKLDLAACHVADYDRTKVAQLFQELGFKSLLSKLPQSVSTLEQGGLFEGKTKAREIEGDYQIIKDEKALQSLVKNLEKSNGFVFDCETDFLNGNLIGISFCCKEKIAFYVPIENQKSKIPPKARLASGGKNQNEKEKIQINKKDFLQLIKPILESPKIPKYGHNLKYDYQALSREGIEVASLSFDTMIASYLLSPQTRAHNLDNIAFVELGYEKIPLEELIGVKKLNNLSEAPLDKVAQYSCEDADISFRLVKQFAPQIKKQGFGKLFSEIEMPLVPILAQMEEAGVKLDCDYLKKMAKQVDQEIKNLKAKIFKCAGCEFNISSTQQLRKILFEDLKISSDGVKRTKTGHSTAASELSKMRGKHKIIDLIMQYRELTKLKNTYIDTLPKQVDKKNRLHTSFNQTITATGRLSSSDPNLQNIPIRTDLGQKMRRAFVADSGHKLISADYSQIELRIVAHLAQDKKMIQAFLAGEDIHSATAAAVYGVPIDKIDSKMRRTAKTVNFGVLYGMSAYGLSQSLRISREEAQDFIDTYFAIYPGIKKYTEEIVAKAKTTGYVETLFGRRRYLPELNSSVFVIRGSAERMAINMPVQGTAADIMKKAMINVKSKIKNQKSKLLLQVHDELVFEVPQDEVKKSSKEIKKIMESVFKLSVPLTVDVSVGDNWQDMKKI